MQRETWAELLFFTDDGHDAAGLMYMKVTV